MAIKKDNKAVKNSKVMGAKAAPAVAAVPAAAAAAPVKGGKKVKPATAAEVKKAKKEANTAAGKTLSGVSLVTGIKDDEFLVLADRNQQALYQAILGSPGFARGRIYEWYGDPGVGKTATAMSIGGQLQRQGVKYLHADAEHALNKGFAKRQLGVDVDKVITSAEPLAYGEQAFEMMIEGMEKHNVGFAILDSIAACKPKEFMEDDKDRIGAHANFMSKQFPRLDAAAAKSKALVFTINQTRINIGVMFGDNTTTTGGKAPGFYSSVRIKVGKKQVIKGENGEELGFICTLAATKNRTGFKRGAFEVTMNRGFVPKLADTAVAWAKAYEQLKLIDKDEKLFCGLPYAGRGSDADLARVIKGSEYLVFEAVNAYYDDQESGRAEDVDDQADTSHEDAMKDATATVTAKVVGKDDTTLTADDGEV